MKQALVTGGGSGIGRETSLALAEAGFRVGVLGRRLSPLNETVAAIQAKGGQAWAQAVDVRDAASIQAAVQVAIAQSGHLDLLINNAGIFKLRPFAQTDRALWDETLETNLTGVYLMTQAAWPYLEGGQVINVSSVAGVQPYAGCAAYSASKYGLIGLSEVLALEGKPRRIRVHVICPGNTETPIWQNQAPDAVQKRMIRPQQIAEVIRWLALSPDNLAFDRLVVRPFADPWAKSV